MHFLSIKFELKLLNYLCNRSNFTLNLDKTNLILIKNPQKSFKYQKISITNILIEQKLLDFEEFG